MFKLLYILALDTRVFSALYGIRFFLGEFSGAMVPNRCEETHIEDEPPTPASESRPFPVCHQRNQLG